jgi:hypothetical protein
LVQPLHASHHAPDFVFLLNSWQVPGAFGAQGVDRRIQLDVQQNAVRNSKALKAWFWVRR